MLFAGGREPWDRESFGWAALVFARRSFSTAARSDAGAFANVITAEGLVCAVAESDFVDRIDADAMGAVTMPVVMTTQITPVTTALVCLCDIRELWRRGNDSRSMIASAAIEQRRNMAPTHARSEDLMTDLPQSLASTSVLSTPRELRKIDYMEVATR